MVFQNFPKHIGFILDGNRRFAKRLMLKPWKGHEWGRQKVEKVIDWCFNLGIKEVSFWVLSLENFNRPKEEFDFLMEQFRDAFEKLKTDERIDKYKIKLRFIGQTALLPTDIQEKIHYLEEKTRNNDGYFINFLIAYGGRAEILNAAKKIAEKVQKGELNVQDITIETFQQNLQLSSSPDLVIRTGGEVRTSGFLIWQTDYSEWLFLQKYWPELEEQDIISAIEDYSKRERRFGR